MGYAQCEAVLKPRKGLQDSMMTAGMDDGQLLARFTERRDELAEIAFATLVRRHGPMVLHVCQQVLGDRHTAEDAFQASFLILARRAHSIRQPELLGNWLYGVALRTAREARLRDHRRRQHELPRSEGNGAEPIDEVDRPELSVVCREQFEVLHEEVSQLPEKYRGPVVLCELEGLTYQEAAQRLRCPVGTIGVRLRRARERLRQRLIRRGLAPTAVLTGALFGADAASADVPSVLVDSTVQAAMGFAATPILGLSEGILATMALIRLKLAAILVLAVGISATIAWLGIRQQTTVATAKVPVRLPSKSDRPSPSNPTASLPTGRPARAAKTEALTKLASPVPAALLALNSKWNETAKELRSKDLNPETRTVQVSSAPSPRDEVARGAVLFVKEWVPNDPTSHGGDGLGPVYNETSCVACHGLGAPGGAGPESKNVVILTATSAGGGPAAKAVNQIHPGFHGTRSVVLHRYGTDPDYGSWRKGFYDSNRADAQPNTLLTPNEDSIEGRIRAVRQQTVPNRRLSERFPTLKPSQGFNLTLAERNTPALFGSGQIDAIPSEVLIAMAERQPAAVRGRISRVGEGRIGKFGWKGQIASLHEFVRGACANEMGLEVPGFSQAISPLDPAKKVNGFDMTESECDSLVAYVRALPAPVGVDPYGPHGTRDQRLGRRLFTNIGCTQCHTPTLGNVKGIYSDLLLHEMGQSLSDSGTYYGNDGPTSPGGPSPGEWRTPPLWGYRDSGPYLHDGRAQDLEEAVALHEGQSKASAHGFFALSPRERSQVEAFLKSLVAPSAVGTPGVAVANQRETRIKPDEPLVSESQVARQRRERELARDQSRGAPAPGAKEKRRSGRQANQSGRQRCRRSRRQAKQGQARTRSGS